jgi:hypothetical protein
MSTKVDDHEGQRASILAAKYQHQQTTEYYNLTENKRRISESENCQDWFTT